MYGGATPEKILLEKREFIRARSYVRSEALWENFANSTLCFKNDSIKDLYWVIKQNYLGIEQLHIFLV